MADVRVNGRRLVLLQQETSIQSLVDKLDNMANRSNSCLTALHINGAEIDLDGTELIAGTSLGDNDVVEARIENTAQLAFESLQVAQEMAELLVFDIKVTTLKLWDSNTFAEKEMDALLKDCHTFLTLGAHPLDLLQRSPLELSATAQECLRELDKIAQNIEDATLLAVHLQFKDACHVLVGRVMPCIERWLGLTAVFAKELEIDRLERPKFGEAAEVVPFRPVPGQVPVIVTR
ncbi:MAG: hypothetical protein RI932_2096 [Pseudomonadota bacterium]|jgi:hypothetical protein